MDLSNFFQPKDIAAEWTEVQSNRIPYLGEGFFPAQKKAGLDLSMIRGHKGLPVSLMPTAFDTKSTFRDREGFERIVTEMPFFRQGFRIGERDRQDLIRIQEAADPYIKDIISRIFDDANNLIEGAMVVPERMRMGLLFPENGAPGFSFRANNVVYDYNYDPNGTWTATNYKQLSSTTAWQVAGNGGAVSPGSKADPFKDFKEAKNIVLSETGTELRYAIMNSTTFDALAGLDAVKDRFLTVTGRSVGYILDSDVKQIVQDSSGLNIIVYDKVYRDESKVSNKFVPDGFVSCIPDGSLGRTWYGTTPEEADLMGKPDAKVSLVGPGIALKYTHTDDPVNDHIFASEIVMPSFERMDECVLMKVFA